MNSKNVNVRIVLQICLRFTRMRLGMNRGLILKNDKTALSGF